MLDLREIDWKALEQLRDEREVYEYFASCGVEISREEINELKNFYQNSVDTGDTLTLQQLDEVSGGITIRRKSIFHFLAKEVEDDGSQDLTVIKEHWLFGHYAKKEVNIWKQELDILLGGEEQSQAERNTENNDNEENGSILTTIKEKMRKNLGVYFTRREESYIFEKLEESCANDFADMGESLVETFRRACDSYLICRFGDVTLFQSIQQFCASKGIYFSESSRIDFVAKLQVNPSKFKSFAECIFECRDEIMKIKKKEY